MVAICGCRKSLPPAAPTESPKEQASITTPPLDLATTTEASGIDFPKTAPEPEKVPNETLPFSPTLVKSRTNVLILMDASGSMAGPIESSTKIEFEKSVVKDMIVQPQPTGMQRSIGVRVFGAQHPLEAKACEDSHQIAPLGDTMADKIGPAIGAIVAQGMSPIAFALQQAAATFPAADNDTDNMIVLIVDGGDTCQADPCQAAADIHAGPSKAMVHVIGFDLDSTATEQLRCVAHNSDGRFLLARNVPELRTAADQALNANLPYNLRIKVFAGSIPLPAEMTVYRSGTRTVVEQGRTPGVKFFQLQPGTYDILITYADSLQDPKPSKLLRGVEVQGSARAEQTLYFELGFLELSGVSPYGEPVALTYALHTPGDTKALATIEGRSEPIKTALTPGEYVLMASGPTINEIPLTTTSDPLTITAGKKLGYTFRFETGELVLRAQTSRGDFVRAEYAIGLQSAPDKTLTKGELHPEGNTIPLPVGDYVVVIRAGKGLLQNAPEVRLDQVTIPARDRVQELITFPVGNLQVIGKESGGTPTKTEFTLTRSHETDILWRTITKETADETTIAPGLYTIMATRLGGNITPPPVIVWEDVEIGEEKTTVKEAIFQLGTLQLLSKDAAGAPLRGEFTLFRPGITEPLATQRTASGDPLILQLTPGLYDVRAQDVSASGDVKPTIWLHAIPVAANETTSREVVFTSGRVRITCRGTNNTPLPCSFRFFTYGQDAPLFSGATEEEWEEFEIKPGYYYLEVDFNDLAKSHHLKKWINVHVAENETVEEIVQF